MTAPDTFAARLRSLMAQAGLDVNALALATNMHEKAIYRLLRERDRAAPSLQTAQRLATALSLPMTCWDGITFPS